MRDVGFYLLLNELNVELSRRILFRKGIPAIVTA